MMRVLFSWIGTADLRASKGVSGGEPGPVAMTVGEGLSIDKVSLLSDYNEAEALSYVEWLRLRYGIPIDLKTLRLPSPTDYESIWMAVKNLLDDTRESEDFSAVYNVSSGTPAMATCWIIMAMTGPPAELVESSVIAGVQKVHFPFDLSAIFRPTRRLEHAVDLIERQLLGLDDEIPSSFQEIIHSCSAMKRVIDNTRRIAIFDVPVLLLGETGTGKEVFARAIHKMRAETRFEYHNISADKVRENDAPFITVNCGAIPENLVEAELFGVAKGYATDVVAKPGYIENATGGTLFLDEIGELPLDSQTKFLRVLQDKEYRRLGASLKDAKTADFKLIAATNRDLISEVNAGRFRADLFHRIAVGVIKIPPLRDRQQDILLLADHILSKINMKFSPKSFNGHRVWRRKQLSSEAQTFALSYPWPGNVRELENAIMRAAILATGPVSGDGTLQEITVEDLRDNILSIPMGTMEDHKLADNFREGFCVMNKIGELYGAYYREAARVCLGKKRRMAEVLGLSSFQTMDNRYRELVEKPGLGESIDEVLKKLGAG